MLPPAKPKLPLRRPKCPYLGTPWGTFQRLERQKPGAGPLLPSAGAQLGHLFVPFSYNFSKILSLYRRTLSDFPDWGIYLSQSLLAALTSVTSAGRRPGRAPQSPTKTHATKVPLPLGSLDGL